MPDDMGAFRVDMVLEHPARPGDKRTVRSVLVDIGAELSWVPAEVLEALGVERNNKWLFRQADGNHSRAVDRNGGGPRTGHEAAGGCRPGPGGGRGLGAISITPPVRRRPVPLPLLLLPHPCAARARPGT